MDRNKRKYETKIGKIFISILIFIILIVIYLFDYDFGNGLWNGLIFFALSFLILVLLSSEKYFIETGGLVKEDIHTEQYKIFNQMHPVHAFRNTLTSILYYVTTIISIIMIVSSFFE